MGINMQDPKQWNLRKNFTMSSLSDSILQKGQFAMTFETFYSEILQQECQPRKSENPNLVCQSRWYLTLLLQ